MPWYGNPWVKDLNLAWIYGSWNSFQPETVRYYLNAAASGNPSTLNPFTVNDYIKAIKYKSGVTLSSVAAYLSLVNGVALVTQPSIDLRWTVGFKLKFTASGKELSGYSKSPGTGETLGTTLVSNGGFDSDVTGWAGHNGTIASIPGGQSGNCCELTRTTDSYQYVQQDSISVIAGSLYKATSFVKSGTSGDEAAWINVYDGSSHTTTTTTSTTWTQIARYYTSPSGVAINLAPLIKYTSTAGTMLVDTAYFGQVLTPSNTGVTITSDGTTRNWASNTGIDPNSASYTLTVTRI